VSEAVLPAIQAAVTRRVISDGTLHGPEEASTAEQAVRVYTTDRRPPSASMTQRAASPSANKPTW
jgi:predicted amidohydrolase YtcJ